MFCPHCGKEIIEGTTFCGFCGANQNNVSSQQDNSAFNAPKAVASQCAKKSKKGSLIGGWIMSIFGVLSILGSFANDTYANFITLGMGIDDFIMVAIQILLVSIGIYLICKNKK